MIDEREVRFDKLMKNEDGGVTGGDGEWVDEWWIWVEGKDGGVNEGGKRLVVVMVVEEEEEVVVKMMCARGGEGGGGGRVLAGGGVGG